MAVPEPTLWHDKPIRELPLPLPVLCLFCLVPVLFPKYCTHAHAPFLSLIRLPSGPFSWDVDTHGSHDHSTEAKVLVATPTQPRYEPTSTLSRDGRTLPCESLEAGAAHWGTSMRYLNMEDAEIGRVASGSLDVNESESALLAIVVTFVGAAGLNRYRVPLRRRPDLKTVHFS